MKHTSILIDTPCELINLTPMNPLISRCQIKVCYAGQNRNGSVITKDVLRQLANSLPGSPIVGFYNEATGDFEEHNRRIDISGGKVTFTDTTKAYGFVDLNAKAWFAEYLDDGVVHTYLVTEGYIWTGQFPESQRILERGNNQSMELDENSLQGSWTIDDKSGMEFFIINEAIISKLCILGEDYEPCFEGASISKFSYSEDINQSIYKLMKEVQKLKGGELSVMDEKLKELEAEVNSEAEAENEFALNENPAEPAAEPETETVEEPETEFAAEQQEETQEEVAEEEEQEQEETEEPTNEEQEENLDNSVEFSLEDFQELQNNYADLETRFNELQNQFNLMQTDYNALIEYKKEKERIDKQKMIDDFYMLSDEEKADVQENIDKYSIDDIEAKLSVICVRNKLNLSENNENQTHNETVFNLNAIDTEEEENVPAWIKALRESKKY